MRLHDRQPLTAGSWRAIAVAALFLLVTLPISAAPIPKTMGYVSDYGNVISSEDESVMTAVAEKLRRAGGIELAVVTIDSLDNDSIESYTLRLAEEWGVGGADTDTGVVLLLAVKDRQVRIEVGYGLEGDLPDGLTGSILDTYVIPDFKKGDFSSGLMEGSKAIAATLASKRDFSLDDSSLESYAVDDKASPGEQISELIDFFVFILFVLVFVFGRGRLWPLLLLAQMSGRNSHHGGGFGSSGRSGGFGGGGFSGFSGGSFGGGGASRSF